jgi:Recombinase.
MINQEEAKIVQWIFENYHNGASFGKIAKELDKRNNLELTLS